MIGKFSKDIEKEFLKNGFHILKKSFVKRNMYPSRFPDFGEINEIENGERYAVRLFVKHAPNNIERIDSGLIDVKILTKSGKKYSCEVLTQLPDNFPLRKGDTLMLTNDEILYKHE